MSKIFVIHPVRNIAPEFQEHVTLEVERLKSEGHDVYDPATDTDQIDYTGLRICKDNLSAIEQADLIYFAWDGASQGCLFDLGMAFALHKPVRCAVGLMPRMTTSKSFQNMAYAWEDSANE
jgi:nucleoside 2-deoxyribosyltransferase